MKRGGGRGGVKAILWTACCCQKQQKTTITKNSIFSQKSLKTNYSWPPRRGKSPLAPLRTPLDTLTSLDNV
jgi:hypothetical protein